MSDKNDTSNEGNDTKQKEVEEDQANKQHGGAPNAPSFGFQPHLQTGINTPQQSSTAPPPLPTSEPIIAAAGTQQAQISAPPVPMQQVVPPQQPQQAFTTQPQPQQQAPQWMPRPENVAGNCPPGLEYLAAIDQVVIQQLVQMMEMYTSVNLPNKYRVINTMGQQCYFANEESKMSL